MLNVYKDPQYYAIDLGDSSLIIKEQSNGSITITASELGQIFENRNLTSIRIYKDAHRFKKFKN